MQKTVINQNMSKKVDLASLKSNIDKIDIDTLKIVSISLSNLHLSNL